MKERKIKIFLKFISKLIKFKYILLLNYFFKINYLKLLKCYFEIFINILHFPFILIESIIFYFLSFVGQFLNFLTILQKNHIK